VNIIVCCVVRNFLDRRMVEKLEGWLDGRLSGGVIRCVYE
jgi:hypothetical protein